MKRIPVIVFLMAFAVCVKAANESWMTGLPDTLRVCRVSIPGTHDSGTWGVWFPMRHYARTQSMDLAEQWDAGIRFFDLRPKLEGDKLKIYHGPANCHISFEESLLILKQKIEENPTEFCIVMTNSAGGGQAAVDMTMVIISSVIPSHMLAPFRSNMTVADMRGRVLFIHRDSPSAETDVPGCVTRGWPGNGMFQGAQLVSSGSETATLWAQDCYTSGNNDSDSYLDIKWRMMEHLLGLFVRTDENVWCINHASGYTGTGVSTNIKKNARITNARLLEYIDSHSGPTGIVPMDFPQQELIDAIIFLNTFAAE